MSDSGLSTPADIPAEAEIEQCLRRVVQVALENDEQITVNLARSRAEVELGLDAGFFKNNAAWKQRSKRVISLAAEEPTSPGDAKTDASTPKPVAKKGTKRKSSESQPTKKRLKSAVAGGGKDRASYEVGEDDAPNVTGKKKDNKHSRQSIGGSEEDRDDGGGGGGDGGDDDDDGGKAIMEQRDGDSSLSDPPGELTGKGTATAGGKLAGDDGSDLSSVIDEPPKRKRKKSTSSDVKEKNNKAAKLAKAGKDLSPDELEIKRLQSYLLKCGVRKVWSRELKKFSTNKEKISHLKTALKDVGMTGRFNAEKARQIRESRELAAELEAAQEFNKHWGQNGGEQDEEQDGSDNDRSRDGAQPRRLRPKGLVDFGDSGDEGSD